MLILSRKSGQKLIIDDNIVITIIESTPTVVKIGIEAPKEVKIFREEVYLEIKSQNISSKSSELGDIAFLEQFAKQPQNDITTKITIKNDKTQ